MNEKYLRSVAVLVGSLQIIIALYYLLRGHNEPGGGFIAGLIAGSAWILFFLAGKLSRPRAYFVFQGFIATGIFVALTSGIFSVLFELPFLTGIWGSGIYVPTIGEVKATNILTFDIGVFFAVMGFGGLFFVLSQEDKD